MRTPTLSRPSSRQRSPTKGNGTDTPRDLNARVKILELYTLHVLLRNGEWDYAREFITMSEVLDEERREAFLQALQSLQDEQKEVANREREEKRYQEEQLQRDIEDARRRRAENEERERQREEEERLRSPSKKTSSETDYGIESSYPSGSSNKAGSAKGSRGKTKSPTARPSVPARKAQPPTLVARATNIIVNLRKVLESMAASFQTNPAVLLRTLAFIVGILGVLSHRDVRQRVRKILAQAWTKVRQTAGMGVKVSYI
ncbi:hypothetical protein B7494_g5941 [Chlorociboria aeruginascens]|nr:hypothetical protein B7494_g5941 [Chlorociboria aeruginascens]